MLPSFAEVGSQHVRATFEIPGDASLEYWGPPMELQTGTTQAVLDPFQGLAQCLLLSSSFIQCFYFS